ncbi:hypothetical protein L1987_01481 [Smallanthus sonchifolius]|uniref:Uncharacterized protein n=1 Tax=Smallanthus sonchifolius TaxID=185202 RepID=A0ACB9K583_9ASTR|nr:hypothetical protein L1987_01481 [Smallanthus sonchifolius]
MRDMTQSLYESVFGQPLQQEPYDARPEAYWPYKPGNDDADDDEEEDEDEDEEQNSYFDILFCFCFGKNLGDAWVGAYGYENL